jgi:ribosome-binding factor A
LLSKKLVLKFAPDLRFQLDETFDRMDDTRRMLAQDVVRRDAEAPDSDPDDTSHDAS